MPICLTFDTERDYYELIGDRSIPAYKEKSFSMIKRAMPGLLEISEEFNIPYTFFLCGEVAKNCQDEFEGLKKHQIGVHTHPFTHESIFKGSSPNDKKQDMLKNYSYKEQLQMISKDLNLIKDNLRIEPDIFRAGKHGANWDTYRALDRLGFSIDCSQHPPFQFVGWQPFKIPNTSIWEIPSYSDMSPEIAPKVEKLFKLSSMSKLCFNGIFVGIIHPMTFGNPTINTELLFQRYRNMVKKIKEMGFEFLTVEEAFNKGNENNGINIVGRSINTILSPIHYLIRNHNFKTILHR